MAEQSGGVHEGPVGIASVAALARNYDFLKALHEDERNRSTRLAQLATAFFGLEGLYISAVAFKFNDVVALSQAISVPRYVFLVALVLMLMALVATIRAVSIQTAEGLAHPKEVAEKLERDPDDEPTFLLHRCVDYAVATEANSGLNDKRAGALWLAGWLIFSSIAVLGFFSGVALSNGFGLLNFLKNHVC